MIDGAAARVDSPLR